MLRTASKYVVLGPIYDFFQNSDLPVITVREKLKIAIFKKAFMYLLERTTQAKVLKLGLYVPWVGFYKSDVGI